MELFGLIGRHQCSLLAEFIISEVILFCQHLSFFPLSWIICSLNKVSGNMIVFDLLHKPKVKRCDHIYICSNDNINNTKRNCTQTYSLLVFVI